MKKVAVFALLAAFVLISVLCPVFGGAVAFASNIAENDCEVVGNAESAEIEDGASLDYADSEAYVFLKEFLEAFPNRSSAVHQTQAAQWLASTFDAWLKSYGSDADYTVDTQNYGDDASGVNVTVRFASANPLADGRQIIVGAHYDSVGQGANDNASGIAALYLIMQSLSQSFVAEPSLQPAFDVVLVAFGGEEEGLLGSQGYLDSMTSSERQNTLVVFNLDSIGGGDNLYVFCENKHTDLADFVLSNATGASNLVEKPYAKGIFALDAYGYGYYEFVQGSDHTTFRLVGIPTVLFFAGNYSGWNYVESTDSDKCVMNTNSDTLENMEKFWGAEFVSKIETVAATVSAVIGSDGFLSVAQNAQSQLVNNDLVFGSVWPVLAVVLLLGITVLFGWLHYRKLQKYALLGTGEATKRADVFTKPEAEDIFDFDDKH